jgi:hypothetical protein
MVSAVLKVSAMLRRLFIWAFITGMLVPFLGGCGAKDNKVELPSAPISTAGGPSGVGKVRN